ncbi:hypothetical protein XENTR_v10017929 [Xenopus tropicalis]|nr:hypothetical protein XENTR_v10017929 [Xenopus tropicalis]
MVTNVNLGKVEKDALRKATTEKKGNMDIKGTTEKKGNMDIKGTTEKKGNMIGMDIQGAFPTSPVCKPVPPMENVPIKQYAVKHRVE